MGLYDFTFYDLVRTNALSFKDKQAWVDIEDGRTLTFSQYKEGVDRLASGLQKYGIQKGDRIGVLAKNSMEYFLLFGSAAALGAIVLPINWRLSAEEVCFNLSDGEPRIVFADKEYQELIRGLKERLPAVEQYFSLGPGGEGFLKFELLTENKGAFKPTEVTTDDGFVIIHTAAVAGRPRGALLSHGNVLHADMHFAYLMNIKPRDVHLNFLPLFHVGGLFMATTGFHAGSLNMNMSKFDAAKATALIQERQVSFMMVFSPILSSILEEHEKSGLDLASLRAVTGIDTRQTIEKYQDVTGGMFYAMYGQTETSCVATFGPYNDRPGAAGRTLPLA
ncbi:MAG: AMP-binding protein, partial [Proteobacteria bacterium]|nr:AMP-binding protein [Pseudomonadota bacterium]